MSRFVVCALVALVLVNGLADAVSNCDVTLPAVTFFAVRAPPTGVHERGWMFSPTTATTQTPSGSTSCDSPSYFGMYVPNGPPQICVNTNTRMINTGSGCQWKNRLSNGDGTFTDFNFHIDCAGTPPNTPVYAPNAVIVQNAPNGDTIYSATFQSELVCGSSAPSPLFRIAKKQH